MPIYEYRCEKCGDFEQMQRITDPPIDRCPRCHRKVRRLISNTSFQLKGSGWYVTDYPRGGAKRDGDTAAKADAKSETKSAAQAGKSEAGKSEHGESRTTTRA